MRGCLYWGFRSVGYLLFAFCALVWLGSAVSLLFLLIRAMLNLFPQVVSVVGSALLGYVLLLFGRFFVEQSFKFLKNQ